MKISIAIIVLFINATSNGQGIDWARAHEWNLYKIQGNKAFACSPDSLVKMEKIALADDSIKNLLSMNLVPKDIKPLWMGSYLCSCRDDAGLLHKIDVSINGAFLYDEGSKVYYQLTDPMREMFIALIQSNYEKLGTR